MRRGGRGEIEREERENRSMVYKTMTCTIKISLSCSRTDKKEKYKNQL